MHNTLSLQPLPPVSDFTHMAYKFINRGNLKWTPYQTSAIHQLQLTAATAIKLKIFFSAAGTFCNKKKQDGIYACFTDG